MTRMMQVGDITPRHLGQNLVVTETGENVITGALTNISVRAAWNTKEPITTISLKTANGEYKLKDAEVDYLLQLPEVEGDVEVDQ